MQTTKTFRTASARRAAAFKQRQRDAGLEQACVWVPAGMVAQLQVLAEALRENPALEVGPLRDMISGRLVSLPR